MKDRPMPEKRHAGIAHRRCLPRCCPTTARYRRRSRPAMTVRGDATLFCDFRNGVATNGYEFARRRADVS
jgi:hypothetical protein